MTHVLPARPGTIAQTERYSYSVRQVRLRTVSNRWLWYTRYDVMISHLGKYSLSAASVCTDCPAGQSCAGANSAPQSCGPGSYSPAGGKTLAAA